MGNSFNFSEHYHKFNNKNFTTIRGIDSVKHFGIGRVVDIKVKRRLVGRAKIYNFEQKRISDIPLDLLKKDGEYPGYFIETKDDFIHLINRFRRFYKITDEQMIVTIWYLKWL